MRLESSISAHSSGRPEQVYHYYTQAARGGSVKAQLVVAEFCMDGKFMEALLGCSVDLVPLSIPTHSPYTKPHSPFLNRNGSPASSPLGYI